MTTTFSAIVHQIRIQFAEANKHTEWIGRRQKAWRRLVRILGQMARDQASACLSRKYRSRTRGVARAPGAMSGAGEADSWGKSGAKLQKHMPVLLFFQRIASRCSSDSPKVGKKERCVLR
ncbi:hypothetical protein [Fundidesulfovibrio butyratiphilus]